MALTAREIQDAYVTFFNRAADTEGFAYWTSYPGSVEDLYATFAQQEEYTDLYGGKTVAEQLATVYQNLFNRAPDEVGTAYWTPLLEDGTVTLANFALTLNRAATGEDITALTAKIDTAVAETDAAIAAPQPGETFVLTTGAEEVDGTDRADAISGVVSSLTTARTFDVTDAIDGGDGSDTIAITIGSDFAGFSTGSMKAVEVVSLTNEVAVARTFTATGVTGVEEYQLTGEVNLANLASIATVTAGARATDLTVSYATNVTKDTADSLALNIEGFGTADDEATTTVDEEKNIDVTVAGVETLALGVSGVNVVDLTNAASKAVNATGAGSLKVVDVNAATKTIDASGVAGAVTLSMATATSATSVKTGDGDDKVTLVVDDDVTANATLAGGTGDDNLALTSGAGVTTQFTQSGFETISIGDLGGALVMSMKGAADVSTIVALGGAADEGDMDENVTIANAGTALSYDLQGANASVKTIQSDAGGSAAIRVSTPATTATSTSPSVNVLSVTATKATSASLTVDDAMDYQGTVTANSATSVEIAVNGEMNGAVTASKATSAVITSVAQGSVINITGAKITDLTTANAKALDLDSSTLSGLESLNSSGAGALDLGNLTGTLSALNIATISNIGDVDLENTGSSTLDYSTTIVATGSKTFDVGTMTTNNQAINLTVSDALGAISAGAIDAGTGAVVVNVSTASTLGLAAITGKAVTIDASGVLGAVTFGGDITAKGNVIIIGSELEANEVSTKNVVLTGTAQSVAFTGGIANDDLLIDNATTSTSITVTGDWSIGTDTLAVNFDAADVTAAYTLDVTGASGYDTGTFSLSDQAFDGTVKLNSSGTDVDKVVFTATSTNKATITGFNNANDIVDITALGTLAKVVTTGSLTTAADKVYTLASTTAGDADTAAAVSAAFNAAAAFTAAAATAYLVISDNNSAAIYKWIDVNASVDEVATTEITLLGTIDDAFTATELAGAALKVT